MVLVFSLPLFGSHSRHFIFFCFMYSYNLSESEEEEDGDDVCRLFYAVMCRSVMEDMRGMK